MIWMAKHKCKHGHSYLEHPSCYTGEEKPPEKVGFLDIECSNLSANFGIILSYAIKERNGKVRGRVITPEELKSKGQDKTLVSECIRDMEKFDRLIGFYSSRFDFPFVRSRAMVHGVHFPGYGEIKQTDLWFWVRGKLRLNSNRLQSACDFLGIPSKGHKLDGLLWTKALSGDKKALAFIYTHNIEDVYSTEELFERMLPFHRMTNTFM